MKPKKLYPFLFTLLFSSGLVAQNVGVGTNTPNAVLEVKATNPASPANTDGIIIPRIDAFPGVNPTALQHGMMVYLTTAAGANQPGFYYWNNSSTSWTSLSGAASSTPWNITGNSGTSAGIHFIGTTDDMDFFFKRNGILSGRLGGTNTSFGNGSLQNPIFGNENTGIGTNALASTRNGSYNTATGYGALFSNYDGSGNTAIGHRALYSNTNGAGNIAIGAQAMNNNSIGLGNVATGNGALQWNSGGNYNVAIGYTALRFNQTGSYNTAVGDEALANSLFTSENTAVGYRSLFSNTIGISNTAIGTRSSLSITTGNDNTAMGTEALMSNISGGQNTAIGTRSLRVSTVSGNTAIGFETMLANTTGINNVAVGNKALTGNTVGESNTAIGSNALMVNNNGFGNSATGANALVINTSGILNTATGYNALAANTTGGSNTAIGASALLTNSTGANNVAAGAQALNFNTIGNNNTAVGLQALYKNTTGSDNSGIGLFALNSNTSGNANNAMGYRALFTNTTGSNNTSIGHWSLEFNSTGNNNTAVGHRAGQGNVTGSNNTTLGFNAQVPDGFASNQVSIANVIYATGTGTAGAGNVGIGTGAPATKLDVAGTTKTTNLQITAGAVNNYILRTDGAGNASWASSTTVPVTENDPKVGSLSANQVSKWNGGQLVNSSITDNGWVGIGTTSPGAQLHITGGSTAGAPSQQRAYFHVNTSNIIQDVSSSGGIIVRGDGWFWANGGGFLATSDARIKNIIGTSNNQTDLATLQKIQITDYKYKDEVGQGNRLQKKVIAQQVKEIYPIAVSQSTGTIPNVFELASSIKVAGTATTITTGKAHGLTTGDEVKLILDKSGEKTYKVTVTASNSFTIPAVVTESVFVYGKKVDDLLNVDYDALTTLNISATQQLIKEVENLKAENAKLRADIQEQMANLLKRLEPVAKR